MEMVQGDLAFSRKAGGVFCAITQAGGPMIGVVDYVPRNYHGDPQAANLELLMIAAPYRSQGIGQAVVEAVEAEIRKDPQVTVIYTGTAENNPQAVKFWKRMGYVIVAGPKLFDGFYCFDFEKRL